jgi:hypothetical protein
MFLASAAGCKLAWWRLRGLRDPAWPGRPSATWKRLNSSPEALWVDSGVRYAFLTSRDQGSEPSKSPYGHGWRLSQGCVPGCSNRIRCCPPRGRCDLRCGCAYVHPTGEFLVVAQAAALESQTGGDPGGGGGAWPGGVACTLSWGVLVQDYVPVRGCSTRAGLSVLASA